MIDLPTAAEPVREILAKSGFRTSSPPTTSPGHAGTPRHLRYGCLTLSCSFPIQFLMYREQWSSDTPSC
jgi:hypothetical protein